MTNSRDKGNRGELEAVRLWRAIGYGSARRGFQYQDGSANADILGVPYWVEVKRYKRALPSTFAAGFRQGYKNMTTACERSYIPDLLDVVVMGRGDHGIWYVLAPVQLLIDLGYAGEVVSFRYKYITSNFNLMQITWEQFAYLQGRFDGKRESS